MARVIIVIKGDEKRLPIAEIEQLLSPGDTLTVVEDRLTDVILIDRRPLIRRAHELHRPGCRYGPRES